MGYYENALQAPINATTSGQTPVVAGVAGRKIRVISLTFTCSAQVNVGWDSAATVLIEQMSFAQYGGMDLNRDDPGCYWCETNVGEALNINLSGNANVRGSLNYVEV